jgi:methionyl-tRNA formyltransferase
VFFGTPAAAVPALLALLDCHHDIVAVVTSPDRPAGRGMEVQVSPVKAAALEAGLAVLQPEKVREPAFRTDLAVLAPDCCVVVAYGKILPAWLLGIPRLGFVNVHFSLLPAYRGAAPVQRALMDGVEETGVSIMLLTEGMDEGPILATESIPVEGSATGGQIEKRLAEIGSRLLVKTIDRYASGAIEPRPQDHDRATYAPKITVEEARIDWARPARRIRDLVRALNPAPGAWTTLGDRRLKVYEVDLTQAEDLAPGELRADGDLVAGTGDGALLLREVQSAGKRRMGGPEFARGLRDVSGMRLG